MQIVKVTITGADDKVDPIKLLELEDQYPFVEWGILWSRGKEGQHRYPSRNYLNFLPEMGFNMSAHFCGWFAGEVLEQENFKLLDQVIIDGYDRVQLNYNFQKRDRVIRLENLFKYATENKSLKIIFQYNKSNALYLNNVAQLPIPENVQFLYDGSGGRGTEMQEIGAPLFRRYTGYAGGITPENVERICRKIDNGTYSKLNAWIDMESGVRTNNEFDLTKVESVLKKAAPFI